MTKTVLYVFVFVSLLAAVAVLLAQVNRQRFRSRVTVEVGALFSDVHQSVGPEHLRSRWGALPEPVRRYFRFAVHDGAPAIRTARLRHDGFFRTRPDQRWLPIEGRPVLHDRKTRICVECERSASAVHMDRSS